MPRVLAPVSDVPNSTREPDARRKFRRIELRRVTKLAHNLDDRALSALGRDPRRREEVNALFLIERADDHLKSGIGKDPGEAENRRRDLASSSGGPEEQGVNRVGVNPELSAAIAGGNRIHLTSRSLLRAERIILRLHRSASARGSSAAKNSLAANVKLPEQPIEAEFLEIILRDLDEFGLDLYLLRSGNARLLDQCVH